MRREEYIRLRELTVVLRENAQMAHDQFVHRSRTSDYQVDFYGEVKPFADRVTQILEEWEPLVMEWLKSDKPNYVFVPQIVDAVENLTIVSVTAFQKDTRRKRFLNTISAIDYCLDTILQQISIPESTT